MALGSAGSSAQARGKNKAVKVKRRKEIRAAKNYNSFLGSELRTSGRDACALRDVNIRYYHNGSHAIPRDGDIVYREKRARGNNRFGPGFIQFQSGGRGFVVRINEAGVAIGIPLPC